jgi:hypothetical protein
MPHPSNAWTLPPLATSTLLVSDSLLAQVGLNVAKRDTRKADPAHLDDSHAEVEPTGVTARPGFRLTNVPDYTPKQVPSPHPRLTKCFLFLPKATQTKLTRFVPT